MFHRLNVCINLLNATLISIIYVPFPDICGDILYYLVKRVNSLVLNGEYYCKDVHRRFRPDEQDACSVVEENEPDDGSNDYGQENEFGRISESESNESPDDKQS